MSSPCLLFEHVSISPGVLVSPSSRVLKCSRHRCQQGGETIAVIVLLTCGETAFFPEHKKVLRSETIEMWVMV